MRRLPAGAAALLGLVAVGCGSSGSAGPDRSPAVDALRVVRAAATATAHAQSVRMSGSMTEQLTGVTVRSGAAPVDVDVSSDFAGVVRTEPMAARLTLTNLVSNGSSIGGPMRELLTPRAIYMRIPQLAAQTGKPWAVMRLADIKQASGIDLEAMLSQAEQMQPAQYLAQLAAAGDVRVVGHEAVRGVPTTHYAGHVPIETALARYDSDVRAQLAPVMRSAGFTGTTIDAWVDGQGQVRRVASSTTGGRGSVAMHIDVLGYDVPVDVRPPPAGQVVDLGRLALRTGR
jgi:hypothetical protein